MALGSGVACRGRASGNGPRLVAGWRESPPWFPEQCPSCTRPDAQQPNFLRGLAGLLPPGQLLAKAQVAPPWKQHHDKGRAPRLGQKLSAATSMQL